MTRPSWSHRLVFAVCAVALGLILGGYAIFRILEVTRHLDRFLADGIRSQIGRDVRSGLVRVTRTGHFTIRNLQIAEGATFKDGVFLQADLVEGQISLPALLRSRDPLSALSRVDITRPWLFLERGTNGRWNFQDLLKGNRRAGKPLLFGGRVGIHDGAVRLLDHDSRLAPRGTPEENRVAHIGGQVQGLGSRGIEFQVAGLGLKRLGPLAFAGNYSPSTLSGTVTASVKAVDLPYWTRYSVPPEHAYGVRAGRADLSGTVRIASGRVDLAGIDAAAVVTGGEISLSALRAPIRGIRARARLSGGIVRVDAGAALDGIPLALTGTVQNLRHPVVDARASTGEFAVERVSRLLAAVKPEQWPGLTGPVKVAARVTGPASDPSIVAHVTSPRLAHPRVVAEGVDATAQLTHGVLSARVRAMRALGGTVTADGAYRLRGPAHPWTASGRFAGLGIQDLAPPNAPSLGGSASGSFDLHGLGKSFGGRVAVRMAQGAAGPFQFRAASGAAVTQNGRQWAVHLAMGQGSVRGFGFRSLTADATVDPATGAVIRNARAAAWKGHLAADGRIARSGAFDLRLRAGEVHLHELLASLGQGSAQGIAAFDGRLTGVLAAPVVSGRLSARAGRIEGIPFDSLDSRLRVTPASLALESATIRSGGSTAALSGTVALAGGRLGPMNLVAHLGNVTGAMLSRVDLGPGRALTLPDDLRPAVLSGTVHAEGRYPRLHLTVRSMDLSLPGGSATASGSVEMGRGGSVRLAARLDQIPAYVVSGIQWRGHPLFTLPAPLKNARVSGDVTVAGPFRDLVGSGAVAVGPMSIQLTRGNPLLIDEARGRVTLKGRNAVFDEVALSVAGETLTGSGQASLDGALKFQLTGKSIPLERAAPFIQTIAKVSGTGDLSLVIEGRPGDLTVEVHVAAGPLVANHVRFDRFSGNVVWNGGTILLNDLILERGDSLFRVPAGSYDFRTGALSLDMVAVRFDVAALYQVAESSPLLETASGDAARRLLVEIPTPLAGIVDGSIRVDGPLENLIARVNLTGQSLILRTLTLDRVVVRATWSATAVQVADLAIDAPDFHLSGKGSRSETTDIQARLANTQIPAILALLQGIPALERTRLGRRIVRTASTFRSPITGSVDAALTVYGPSDDPQGELSFDIGSLALGPQTFDLAQGALALRGRRMYIEDLRLEGREAVITASGSGGFSGDLDFNLNAYNLNVQAIIPWLGLPANLTGVVDVLSVQVTGTQTHPILQASLDAHDVGTTRFAVSHLRAFGIEANGDQLRIDRVELTDKAPQLGGAEFVTVLNGSLPFRFSPLSIPGEGKIALHAAIERQNLAVLAAFTPEIKSAGGTFGGTLDVGGTVAHPAVTGALTLQDGSIQFARFRNQFIQLNGAVTLADNRLTLADFRGASDRGGDFHAAGTVSLVRFPQGAAQLTFNTQELMLLGSNVSGILGEQFQGRLNADVTVTGPLTKPVVGGFVLAHNLALTLPEVPPPASQAPAILFPVNAKFDNFRLIAGAGVEVRRGTFLGGITGSLTVNGALQEPHEPYIAGRFLVNNGRVHVATKTFRIQDGGTITVAYRPPDLARIAVDIQATTQVTTYSNFDQARKSYTVTVTLTGSIDNPTLDFRADPPDLSHQQILAALGYQAQIEAILRGGASGDRAFRQGVAEAFTGVVAPTLLEPLDFAIMRALGLEDFAISYDYTTPLQVQFTKRLWGKMYFTYRRQISGVGQDYMMKFYYRLTPRVSLSYTNDERHANTLAIEGRLAF